MTRIDTTCHSPAGHEEQLRSERVGALARARFCFAVRSLALLAQCSGALASEVLGDLIPYPHTAWTAA